MRAKSMPSANGTKGQNKRRRRCPQQKLRPVFQPTVLVTPINLQDRFKLSVMPRPKLAFRFFNVPIRTRNCSNKGRERKLHIMPMDEGYILVGNNQRESSSIDIGSNFKHRRLLISKQTDTNRRIENSATSSTFYSLGSKRVQGSVKINPLMVSFAHQYSIATTSFSWAFLLNGRSQTPWT